MIKIYISIEDKVILGMRNADTQRKQVVSASSTAQNMREYGFSLTRIPPHKDKIVDFLLIRENTGQ